ncbi:DUF6090 family protein [Seonamhaeicola aphaedonensis]|uniref:Uncharacterized protein n=1 Tax=Seonamhaeicola aphaedonensis TaxID=1461338 RepID=A0A3D9H423_9FLAO|nr:DUF6090 family protein [Seonamhaeicola aphaedonensis]RED44247.1 hypothetical protein DFQ02_1137 [Seonamhaeicola aphaedonensis]
MIKFFRKIRQKLLSENKFSRYLIYAIGEIVLVVVGILIALAINNWNINNANKKEEIYYLQKLKLNLQQDTTHVRTKLRLIYRDLSMLDSLEIEIKNPLKTSFSNRLYTTTLLLQYGFSPQTSTFDNLKSTGKLNLINNQILVDSLFVYYNDLENSTKQKIESMETYGRNSIGPYLMKFDEIAFHEYLTGTPRKSPNAYGNDVFIMNAINLKRWNTHGLREDYEMVYQRAVSLIEMIGITDD